MPWKIFEENGEHCVHKENADGSKGELVHCHPTRAKAVDQMRALYASESKEITEETVDLLKEIMNDGEDGKRDRAYAVINEWHQRVDALAHECAKKSIEEQEDSADKESDDDEDAIASENRTNLLSILKDAGEKIVALFTKDDNTTESGISIWKEGGMYWWLARYSNNFRDRDNPPEIISSESHKNFVRMVKEGEVELPELWLWHKKEWKIGKAHGVAYDDAGFAVAIGTFDPDKEHVAEALMKNRDALRVSHGMPVSSIVRDEKDSSIIVRHITREISPLPAWAAANPLTGFAILERKEESTMTIPDETKKEWVERLKIDPSTLESLEAANAKDATEAISEGLESKETDAALAQPATPAEVTAPVAATEAATEPHEAAVEPATTATEQPVSDNANAEVLLRSAVVDAVSSVVTPLMERIDALEASVKELKEASDKLKADSDEQKEALVGTPTASLATLITGYARSAVGSQETRVDGRTSLAKSKPAESTPAGEGQFRVPFLNEMVNGQ